MKIESNNILLSAKNKFYNIPAIANIICLLIHEQHQYILYYAKNTLKVIGYDLMKHMIFQN